MKSAILTGINLARQLLNKAESKLVEQEVLPPEEALPPPPESQDEMPPESPEAPADPNLSTVEDRAPMNDLLRTWARASGNTFKELKAKLTPRPPGPHRGGFRFPRTRRGFLSFPIRLSKSEILFHDHGWGRVRCIVRAVKAQPPPTNPPPRWMCAAGEKMYSCPNSSRILRSVRLRVPGESISRTW